MHFCCVRVFFCLGGGEGGHLQSFDLLDVTKHYLLTRG